METLQYSPPLSRNINNPLNVYENHLSLCFSTGHNGAVYRACSQANKDFDKILRTGERLIVTATMGRGVRLDRSK